MDDSVLYRLLPHATLPHGPVSIILTPAGKIRVLVDERYLDPLLAAEFSRVSCEIMRPRTLIKGTPPKTSPTKLRIARVSDAGGLLAADVTPSSIDLLVDKELMSAQIPGPLSAQGAAILRHFS
jgi:hypothetical protein